MVEEREGDDNHIGLHLCFSYRITIYESAVHSGNFYPCF